MLGELKEELPEIDLSRPASDPRVLAYFDYFGLDLDGIKHFFGGVPAGNGTIAVHVFLPESPAGTVITAHGYFDHTGALKHLIRYLVGESYAVLTFDFQGHGLSSGEAGYIEDFSEYLSVLTTLADLAERHLPGPLHFVGHSMGAGVMAEYLLTNGKRPDQRVVFISPNIRSGKWGLSMVAYALIKPFTDSVSRVFRATSHDEEFLEFREHLDPLQTRRILVKWFKELVEWTRRMTGYEPTDIPLRIIQGDSDGTTDQRYNTEFLKDKFPNLELFEIEGGEHHLINEANPMRDETLRLIAEYLRS